MHCLDKEPPSHRCASCLKRSPPYDHLLSGWIYQPPFDSIITALKFRGLDYLGGQVGQALAAQWACVLTGKSRIAEEAPTPRPHLETTPPDIIVPIPLHWRRQWNRGYNQAELLAEAIAKSIDRPMARILRRRIATPPQAQLDRSARAANIRQAFALKKRRSCAGKNILLVDDVLTTGSTIQEAATLLRRSGAKTVIAMVAARTPKSDEAAGLAPIGHRAQKSP